MSKSFAEDFMKTFDDLSLPREISERFDIMECLAKNNYGETYLLSEIDSGKRYVLKCCKKTESMGHESQILSGLSHRGLPTFEPEIETDEMLFVLREYIEGVPLDEYLSERQIGEEEAVNIVLELCDILSYLHSQPAPIIHRDIKPSNVIVNPSDGKITLIDFGISRKYSEDADTDTSYFGTQKFAPPEQYGYSQTDCRADIYALGIVLRYLLTGTTESKTGVKDSSLLRIAGKCSAFSPKERFQSADALKRALIRQKKRINQKILYSFLSVSAAIVIFMAGFSVGRYTDLFPANETIDENNPNENVYLFTEPLIEEAVRLMLGKEDGQPVMREELVNINAIYIAGGKVAASREEWDGVSNEFRPDTPPFGTTKSINDLTAMENLMEVQIVGQPLSDLTPLSGNIRLNTINANHCHIPDVSALKDLPRLNDLSLFDNLIDDFTVFESFESLDRLDVGLSPLNSISELGSMPKIEFLNVHLTDISNLDGIENFPNLKSLYLTNTLVQDFSPLDSLPYMEEIIISEDMKQYLHTLKNKDINVIVTE